MADVSECFLGRGLAVIRTYKELHAAIRARAESLKVSRDTLDERTGLQTGYSAKLLGPVPIKNFGATSLGPMLAALGVALVLIEDPETFARITAKMPKRDESRAHASHDMLPVRRQRNRALFNSDASKVMNARRHLLLTPNQRRRIAKAAAHARWKGNP